MSTSLNYTVVIPTYCSTGTLKNTLDSVVKQTFQPDKIIVVDDCSEDIACLVEIVESYHDVKIQLQTKASKGNAAESRNIGWRLSTTPLVFFLDSDDIWLPDHAKNVVKIFKNKKCEVVFGGFICDYDDGILVNEIADIDISKECHRNADYIFNSRCEFRTSTLAVKSKLFDKVRFDDSARKHQDWDIFLSFCYNAIPMAYNYALDTRIYSFGAHRMSYKNNLSATEWFISKWNNELTKENIYQILYPCLVKSISSKNKSEVIIINSLSRKHRVIRIILLSYVSLASNSIASHLVFSLKKLKKVLRK
ncbi:glycosyltransferase family 2 protein [Vibrio breoganii]